MIYKYKETLLKEKDMYKEYSFYIPYDKKRNRLEIIFRNGYTYNDNFKEFVMSYTLTINNIENNIRYVMIKDMEYISTMNHFNKKHLIQEYISGLKWEITYIHDSKKDLVLLDMIKKGLKYFLNNNYNEEEYEKWYKKQLGV